MTPPTIKSVNIQPLDNLYLENLLNLDIHEAAKQFSGTDLALDTQNGDLKRLLAGGKTEATSLDEEAAWIQLIRETDTNNDKSIDLEEVKNLLASNLAAEQANSIDPNEFLASIDSLMTQRYAPLAANMVALRSYHVFTPTLEAVKLYNDGIFSDEISLAQRTFALNGLGKTATNVVGFIPSLARNLWAESPLLLGDEAAKSSAEGRYQERKAAIASLEQTIAKGIEGNEAWAMEGNLSAAIATLDEETRDILETELCASRLHKMLSLEEPKERYEALLSFAETERPGFLGYGGGNSRMREGWFGDWWNLSGRRNNLFFAKTMSRFLGVKTATEDPNYDQDLHERSRNLLTEMNGDGLSGFNNLAAVGLTNIFCIGGNLCDTTPYRNWSDEASMDSLGRGIDGALLFLASRRAFTFFGDVNRLSKARSLGESAKVWWQESSLFLRKAEGAPRFNPLAGDSLRKAAVAAEQEAEALQLSGASIREEGVRGVFSRISKPFSKMKKAAGAWLFRGLPPLSATQTALLKKSGSLASNGMGRLTRGVLIVGIMQYSDEKLSPPYNPFEHGLLDYNPEADFERYPDPTKPDPAFHAPVETE